MQSKWVDFIRDFGDAAGGIGIGYAIGCGSILYGVLGALFILISIYLRFYK